MWCVPLDLSPEERHARAERERAKGIKTLTPAEVAEQDKRRKGGRRMKLYQGGHPKKERIQTTPEKFGGGRPGETSCQGR